MFGKVDLKLEFWLHMVNGYPWLLEYVPERYKTQELCVIVVEQDKSMIQFVPEHLKGEI